MAKRKFRYDGGGSVTEDELEIANKSEDPIASLNAQKGWTGTKEESKAEDAPKAEKKQSFKEAFAEARKGGDKSFEWNGKKYSTEVAGSSTKATPKATDTGDESSRLGKRYAKPTSKYETPYDRMNRVNREEGKDIESRIANASNKGQDRILTGIKKKADENKFMGSVKMKSGGSVSSASRRADGIATKGKTRGKMC